MPIDIELIGKTNHWSYKQRHIRIGRDSSCDVSLPASEYPMVSREHAVLEVEQNSATLSDRGSANGTFLNGTRVNTATVQSGDTIRLGADGPELRFQLTQEPAPEQATRLQAEAAATRISGQPAGAAPEGNATVVQAIVDPGAAATMLRTELQEGGATVLRTATGMSTPASGAVRIAMGTVREPEPVPATKPTESPKAPTLDAGLGDRLVIEQKLGSIRNLLAANLVVLVLLLLGLVYENQQINRNRDDLLDMRKQAQTAVGQFTPALDARLSAFEKRMDGFDGKMKETEDRFVNRVNTDMPVMLDKYFNRKMEEMKKQANF